MFPTDQDPPTTHDWRPTHSNLPPEIKQWQLKMEEAWQSYYEACDLYPEDYEFKSERAEYARYCYDKMMLENDIYYGNECQCKLPEETCDYCQRLNRIRDYEERKK